MNEEFVLVKDIETVFQQEHAKLDKKIKSIETRQKPSGNAIIWITGFHIKLDKIKKKIYLQKKEAKKE